FEKQRSKGWGSEINGCGQLGDAERDTDQRAHSDSDQQRTANLEREQSTGNKDNQQRERRGGIGSDFAEIPQSDQSGWIGYNDAGVFKSDESDEDSDTDGDGMLEVERDGVDD